MEGSGGVPEVDGGSGRVPEVDGRLQQGAGGRWKAPAGCRRQMEGSGGVPEVEAPAGC